MIQEKASGSPSHHLTSSGHLQQQKEHTNPFSILKALAPNLLGTNQYKDDDFKLATSPQNKNISLKKLSEIYAVNTSLYADETGKEYRNPTKKIINNGKPTYLSELNMLPFQHYRQLISPPYINEQGYYHVVMWKDGIMTKQLIDDTVYYDNKHGKIVSNPALQNYPWVHILLKAWAKRNRSYQASQKCLGFQFIKTFTYPDWQYLNPSKQKQEFLNKKFAKATNNQQLMICKTKSSQDVGLYGFTANCASFIIRRHYQEYGEIFLIIEPFVHDCWNKVFCSSSSNFPEDAPQLKNNQFLIPMQQFMNVFYLVYITKNKYNYNGPQNKKISYQKYTLNVDARDTKAIVLGLQVLDELGMQKEGRQNIQIPVGVNFYFPSIKIYDIVNKPRRGEHKPGDLVVPWAKVMIAQHIQSSNADASYVESVKQKILDYGQNLIGFASFNPNYEFIEADYFQGYCNQLTYNLSLKPGKYHIRIKIEQKQSEYRCHINSTAINGRVKIFDPKLNDKEQLAMLKQCLISKAKKQKKMITYVNPIKKGSWIICRKEFETLGYGYIVIQTIKLAENWVIATVDPKKLREEGYEVKGSKKDQSEKVIKVESDETVLIILKYDKNWKEGERVWPPQGISFTKMAKIQNK